MKIKKTEFCFYISYIFIYIALFLGDIYDTGMVSRISRILRLISYIIILVQIFYYKLTFKNWIKFFIIFVLTLFFGLCTDDFYWSILIVFIYASKRIKQNNILIINMHLLCIGIFCTLLLCLFGVLPDIMTARNTNISNTFVRHSFGFYHSNVLPLLILYFELYYVFFFKEKVKFYVIFIFIGIQLLLYILCDSRNAFYLAVIFTNLIFIEKYIGIKKNIQKIFYLITRYSVVIMSVFSFLMIFLLLKGGIWDVIDRAFSGRFRLAIFKMRRIGLHLINFMSNEDFFSDSINYVNNQILDTVVLDNGYLYIILRYGILAILFYFTVSFLLAKKFRNNIYALTVLLIVFIANFIDNDLVDYSFLAFILIAFNNSKCQTDIEKLEE